MIGDHAARRQTGRKAVLFCRACGHDAPLDADWDVTDSGHGHTEIACTECGHVVVTQPTFDDADESDALLAPVAELVSTVVESSVSSTRFAGRLH
jgi:DNA-directed RNA polymerase subunit RPC12/RpoP